MSFQTLDIYYFIGLMLIPGILIAVYYRGVAYFAHLVAAGGILLVILMILDTHSFLIYGGIMVSFIIASYVAYTRGSSFAHSLNSFNKKIDELHARINTSGSDTSTLKETIKNKEKDIERSIYMYSIVKGLAETINWKSMMPVIARALRRFFDASEYALYLTDEHEVLRAYHKSGTWPGRISPPHHFSLPIEADPSWADTVSSDDNITKRNIAIPFLNKDQIFGILLLTPRRDSSADVETLLDEAASLQVQLLFGMERAKLYHDIEIRSLVDGLTHLYRRQYFDLKLEDEIARAQSFSTGFGLVMFDIDHFKEINDTYGHQAGDEVLSILSSVCRTHVYETDFCARYGGEEFVIICPRAEREGLLRKMVSFCEKIQALSFGGDEKKYSITVSIGIAQFPAHGSNSKDIIAAADRALYAAKHAGRNTIKEYGPL